MRKQIVLNPDDKMPRDPQWAREPQRVKPAVGAIFPHDEKNDCERNACGHQLELAAPLLGFESPEVVFDIRRAGWKTASGVLVRSVLAIAQLLS